MVYQDKKSQEIIQIVLLLYCYIVCASQQYKLEWWNGRHAAFRLQWEQSRGGSTPLSSTNIVKCLQGSSLPELNGVVVRGPFTPTILVRGKHSG